jgi:exopolysaccharide biosynthesis polyprenyl glycosylphosphotransferase
MIDFSIKNHRVLLVVEKECVKDLASRVRASYKHRLSSLAYYNLDGCYGMFSENGELTEGPLSCNGPADGIVKAIKETNSNEIFIATHLSYPTVVDTMLGFRRNGTKFMFSPEAYEKCIGKVGRNNGWVLPSVDLNTGNLSRLYRIAKRCIDIFISLSSLILFSPLFVVIPILIKLTSRGPVFFTQMRCGHNGRPFKIYKFRSMVADAEKILPKIMDLDNLHEPVFKLKDDPRTTFIGKILRRTSIDELPQLFNVLKGDLSLVGPRPEEIALVKRYNSFFRERLKAKPGITGLQQVTCRGSTSLMERMRYDLAYIKQQSLWVDIKILFKTFGVVVLQKRAT